MDREEDPDGGSSGGEEEAGQNSERTPCIKPRRAPRLEHRAVRGRGCSSAWQPPEPCPSDARGRLLWLLRELNLGVGT